MRGAVRVLAKQICRVLITDFCSLPLFFTLSLFLSAG